MHRSDGYNHSLDDPTGGDGGGEGVGDPVSLADAYLIAYYWSVTTLTTIGCGEHRHSRVHTTHTHTHTHTHTTHKHKHTAHTHTTHQTHTH